MARCAWCGTENDPSATSCSSCGTRLGPVDAGAQAWSSPLPPAPSPTVPVSGPMGSGVEQPYAQHPATAWRAPVPWPEPVPSARGRSVPSGLWIGLVVAVLATMGVFFYLKLQRPISFPGSIAGYQHDESQIAKAATDFLEKSLKSVGIQAKAAIYGDISAPAFIVIGYERSGSTSTASLDEFARGFDSSSGGTTVVLEQKISENRNGVDYTCAPLQSSSSSTQAQARAVCMWQDVGTGGFVISGLSSDPGASLDLSAQIHDAVAH